MHQFESTQNNVQSKRTRPATRISQYWSRSTMFVLWIEWKVNVDTSSITICSIAHGTNVLIPADCSFFRSLILYIWQLQIDTYVFSIHKQSICEWWINAHQFIWYIDFDCTLTFRSWNLEICWKRWNWIFLCKILYTLSNVTWNIEINIFVNLRWALCIKHTS